MAARRTTFDKIQRERAKKAKAAAKRERRQSRGEDGAVATVPATGPGDENLTAPELLERIEQLHQRYAAGALDLDTFEEQRTELYERLSLLPMD